MLVMLLLIMLLMLFILLPRVLFTASKSWYLPTYPSLFGIPL